MFARRANRKLLHVYHRSLGWQRLHTLLAQFPHTYRPLKEKVYNLFLVVGGEAANNNKKEHIVQL
jgi:hypothetical protein